MSGQPIPPSHRATIVRTGCNHNTYCGAVSDPSKLSAGVSAQTCQVSQRLALRRGGRSGYQPGLSASGYQPVLDATGIALWTVQALWTCACVHGVRVVVLLLCDEIRRHICAQSSFIIHNTSGMRMRVARFHGLGIRVCRRRLLRMRAPAAVASAIHLSVFPGSWYRPVSWYRR